MRGYPELGDIFRAYGPAYRQVHGKELPVRQLRTMGAIEMCRTAELGGHVEACDGCGAMRIAYNSCRNRHCPKCQGLDKERWLEARRTDVLPTRYFHPVFTVPESLRPLALRNQEVIYNILFRAVSETLKELAKDPKHLGAEIGFIAILHSWSQTLIDHLHIHCIVPGGGLSLDGKRWISFRKRFFIRVEVLSRLFRGKFLDYLKRAYRAGHLIFPGKIKHLKGKVTFARFLTDLYSVEWVVNCKPPLRSAEEVIDYLGRYTHRVALSNDRIVRFEHGQVSFRYRDSNDSDKIKLLSLNVFEFIRRFLLHILPNGFVKIRHYGILSNRSRRAKLQRCRELLGVQMEQDKEKTRRETWQELLARITGIDPRVCPHCGEGKMVLREVLLPQDHRAPP
jgi:Putative transposase/Transposase zinc-binding domain